MDRPCGVWHHRRVELRVLGPIEVYGPGGLVEIRSARQRALLGILALHAGEVVSRDRLINEVWGSEPPETAGHALEVHISGLRSTLGRELIETRPTGYVLSASSKPVDLRQFESQAREGIAALEAGDPAGAAAFFRPAIALWRGDALEDLAAAGVATSERAWLDTLREAITERWLDAELALGHHLEILPELRRAVVDHPLREGLHERLALALYRSGRQAEALEAYHAARRLLDEELGVEPGPGLQALERAILRHDPALAPPAASDPGTMTFEPVAAGRSRHGIVPSGSVPTSPMSVATARERRPTHLPPRLTSFVGRGDALRDLRGLVEMNRLVTLTGPGGVGKTSLAVELARQVSPEFAEGAWFVPLENVSRPDAVAAAITTTLGLREIPAGAERERLLDNLSARNLLLVLDNMDHVVDAAPLIADIVVAAPDVRVLATSRVPLLLTAEQRYPVGPLLVPEATPTNEVSGLDSIPAIRLFVDRARRVEPSFELGPENVATILEICRRVDGLPLGIELAAAQVASLGPDGVLDRLNKQLPVSDRGMRDQPARQQTLEAAIGWSYDLLDEPAGELLALLTVFAGGARPEQIAAVVLPAMDQSAGSVADRLATLVRHSLISGFPVGGGRRYSMLETVRAFAASRLPEDTRAARRRHALAYLDLAEDRAAWLPGRGQVAVLERLAEDRDNLRIATRWAIETGEVEVAQRLAAAMWRFWQFRGDLGEGRSTIDAVLAMPDAQEPTIWRARALEAAGALAYWANDPPAVERFYREHLQLAQTLGDPGLLADAWFNFSFTAVRLEESDIEMATRAVDEAAECYRALADDRGHARTLWRRALLVLDSGEVDAGRQLLERAIERFRELDDPYFIGMSAGYLYTTHLRQGEPVVALEWARVWLEMSLELGDVATLVRLVDASVDALVGFGLGEEAMTMLGAQEAASSRYAMASIRPSSSGMAPNPVERAREDLDHETLERALVRGSAMDLAEAAAFLIETVDRLLEANPAPR
jgi:predicted ATPase/DNA-binding SARP family transcriptional activator